MTQTHKRKFKVGTVVSNKMQKTVTVRVERTIPHPRYGKVVKSAKTYYAHNEMDQVEPGMKVQIQETRPLSKTKRWIVTKVMA